MLVYRTCVASKITKMEAPIQTANGTAAASPIKKEEGPPKKETSSKKESIQTKEYPASHSVQIPPLKNLDASSHDTYTFYEPGLHHVILYVDSESNVVDVGKRVPGSSQFVESPIKLKDVIKSEILERVRPGTYIFDVVIHNTSYNIVDVLKSSQMDLYDLSYRARLEYLKALFPNGPAPQMFLKTISGHLDEYKGIKEYLIAKHKDTALKYNADFKYIPPNRVYSIVGRCTLQQKSKALKTDEEQQVPSSSNNATATVVKQQQQKTPPKTIYLLADCVNEIFGWCYNNDAAYENELLKKPTVPEHVMAKNYKWRVSHNQAKYTNIEYFKTPILADFSIKTGSRHDLYRMQLHSIIIDRQGNMNCTVDVAPLHASKKRNSPNRDILTELLNNVNAVTFRENYDIYYKMVKEMTELKLILGSQCSRTIVQAPLKRSLDGVERIAKKAKLDEQEGEESSDEETIEEDESHQQVQPQLSPAAEKLVPQLEEDYDA